MTDQDQQTPVEPDSAQASAPDQTPDAPAPDDVPEAAPAPAPDDPDASAPDGLVVEGDGDPADPNTRSWVATPDTTPDGQPMTQQGRKTGPAAGPSPDAGGTTHEPDLDDDADDAEHAHADEADGEPVGA